MNIDPTQLRHIQIFQFGEKTEFTTNYVVKGLFKKRRELIEFSNTLSLINTGIKKFGEKYVQTLDSFVMMGPEPFRISSKVSYDELVNFFNHNQKETSESYDDMKYGGESISNYSLLKKKFFHISNILLSTFPKTTNPNDPDFDEDYDPNRRHLLQLGPPSEQLGPMGKPFGDFKSRLIHDNVLINLFWLHYTVNKSWYKETLDNLIKTMNLYEKHLTLETFPNRELLNKSFNVVTSRKL